MTPREIGYLIEVSGYLGALWLVVTVHELGHLVAVKLCGFRWQEFAAGALLLRRVGNLRTRAEWRWNWFLGYVRYTHGKGTPTLGKELFVALSGIAFNLLTYPAVGALATWLNVPVRSFLANWLPMVGMLTLLTAIGNAFPFRIPSNDATESDGLRILNLLRAHRKNR
ncbi:MAG: M50 family metallopeptidase [Armatimonas sp.]